MNIMSDFLGSRAAEDLLYRVRDNSFSNGTNRDAQVKDRRMIESQILDEKLRFNEVHVACIADNGRIVHYSSGFANCSELELHATGNVSRAYTFR